jgi:hypothetical protein
VGKNPQRKYKRLYGRKTDTSSSTEQAIGAGATPVASFFCRGLKAVMFITKLLIKF